MDDNGRLEYEQWIRENKVPDYKRALYNDDPALVMAAVMKEQEEERRAKEEAAAERARLAEIERRNSGADDKNPGIYGDRENEGFEEKPAEEEPGSGNEEDRGETPEKDPDSVRNRSLYDAEEPQKEPEKKEKKKFFKKTKAENAGSEKKKAKKKSSKKSGNAWKYVLAASVAAALVLIIAISIVNSLDFGTFKLGYVTIGEVSEQGAAKAYFARKSEAVYSPASGIFMSAVSEGDKIEAGGIVGYIVTEEDKGVLAKLKQVNSRILALVSVVGDATPTETEIKLGAINQRLEEERAKLTKMASTGNIEACGEVENTINSLISERNALLMETENGSDSIITLKREKEELEKIVNEKMVPVRTEKAGVVSFFISDSENVENELYSSLRANDGNARLSSLSLLDNAGVSSKLNGNVKEDEKVCKLITDQSYYVILKITRQVSSLGGIVTVKSGDLTYQAAGTVGDDLYGQDYAVISTMRGLKNTLKNKNLDVTYDVSKSSGYCVPLTALSDWDKNNTTARLAIVKAGYVQFMYVGIKAWDDEKAIITASPYDDAEIVYSDGTEVPSEKIATITAGTCYVVNSENVRDGQLIS